MRAENRTPTPATSPGRKPLDAAGLARAVLRPGGLWRAVEVVDRTGSTNADLLGRALGGAPEGVVLAAEEQSAGRGRMGRTWVSPPRAALTFSLLVRPATVPPARRGWLPLLAGVAVASAVTAVTGVQTRLKWPNDVLVGPAKLAGILAETAGDAIVVGVGLNVSAEPGELPPPGPGALAATSLRIAASASAASAVQDSPALDSAALDSAALDSAALDREPLLIAILADFERRYQAWSRVGGDPERSGLRAGYTRMSGTISRRVRAELPGGQVLSGLAVGVDLDGRLLVRVSSGTTLPVAAGDVVHLRLSSGDGRGASPAGVGDRPQPGRQVRICFTVLLASGTL
jgi:BirA family transcriptional regulator, biotin operon repressor / biotin---[acetyl-CoA-carboxylase] ligase